MNNEPGFLDGLVAGWWMLLCIGACSLLIVECAKELGEQFTWLVAQWPF